MRQTATPPRIIAAIIASVTMPQLEKVKYERNLSELIDAKILPKYEIRKAFQKVRVDEFGAEASLQLVSRSMLRVSTYRILEDI